MATHSSIFAWRMPQTEERSPWRHKELDTTERLHTHNSRIWGRGLLSTGPHSTRKGQSHNSPGVCNTAPHCLGPPWGSGAQDSRSNAQGVHTTSYFCSTIFKAFPSSPQPDPLTFFQSAVEQALVWSLAIGTLFSSWDLDFLL